MAEFAVVAGVGAAVVLGWGCAAASADDASGSTSGASEASSETETAAETEDGGAEQDDTSEDSEESVDEDLSDDVADDPAADLVGDLVGDPAEDPAEDKDVAEVVVEDAADEDAADENDESAARDTDDAPPAAPAALPQAWVMTAAARRELESEVAQPSESEPIEPTPAPAPDPEPTDGALDAAPEESVVYTPEPTLLDKLTAASMHVVQGISKLIGIDLGGLITTAIARDRPPSFLTGGLEVRRSEYEVSEENVWQVWEFHPPNPTGKGVVAVHGGPVHGPTVLHWLDYTSMARDTGATVIVPLYRLPGSAGGSATTIAPAMAQFLSDRIAEYGAENLSVHADSAGSPLAVSTVRHLILGGQPVPASMVLLSPATELPVEDAVLAVLPSTTIYVGALEAGLTDTLALQQKWTAAGGAVSVVVGQGQIHNWALAGSPNSQADAVRPDLYLRLGLNDVVDGPRTITTGPPSFGDQLVIGTLRFLRWFSETTGISLFSGVVGNVTSTDPPSSQTDGLVVTAREFNGWTVWELAAPQPSGEYVVALHGGGFAAEANILHWSDYAQMARDTGATVLVPIYPLAPPLGTGTALTLVPPMADYLSLLIDEHGVENVSVYGDSSGGSFAVLAVQELVRRCRAAVNCVTTESQPSRMVLVSPALHITLRSPEVEAIDDPILPRWDPDEIPGYNGELDMDDYRVNPISSDDLTGLPPTALYIGTQEQLYPGALAFRDKLLAQDPDADFTVIIGDGQMHGWALGGIVINSQAPIWRATVYRQLGLLPEVNSARIATLTVA